MPSDRFDCTGDPDQRRTGIAVALASLARGELIVAPTDTVYGIACDAFEPGAVARLLAAKGRGRDMPVPVLVGTVPAYQALAAARSDDGDRLVEAFWPGPLTVVCLEQRSLRWDLGDAAGTVALRMPDHPLMLELLTRHGPLAVSSANRSGESPATTCDEAQRQLGELVQVYLDGGPSGGEQPSTIVDLTGDGASVLRLGAISLERLREVVPGIRVPGEAAADG